MKVLIGNSILMCPNKDGTAISAWLSEPFEGLAVCMVKAVLSFLSYRFKPRNRTCDFPPCNPTRY